MRMLVVALASLVLVGPAAGAERDVFFGDAFRLEAADPGPFDRLADGRLVCLSEACAGRTVAVGGVTVRVAPSGHPEAGRRGEAGLPRADGCPRA